MTSSRALWGFLLVMVAFASAQQFTCPPAFSNGPCFNSVAKNWTEAQRTCEHHGSTLATVGSATVNADLGAGGCFSPAPWNGWQCTWVGLNDIRNDGSFEWASGAVFNYSNWGTYEPDSTEGNTQDCTAVCQGGSIDGYSGYFWIDEECSREYTFCCDPDTFVYDAGTPPEDSYLASLESAPVAPSPPYVDPNPYAERQLCFSSQLTWADAQSLCQTVGSNLLTIRNTDELDHLGQTVHFSRVPSSWGLDWKCVWTGLHDQREEGNYQWVSQASTGFIPPFGPFEAGNGDGDPEDCVALCRSACDNSTAPGCTDLSEYGYTGNFLMDAQCSMEFAFCCDGTAATFVADAASRLASEGDDRPTNKDALIAGLAVLAGISTVVAVIAIGYAAKVASRRTTQAPTLTSLSGVAMYTPPQAGGDVSSKA